MIDKHIIPNMLRHSFATHLLEYEIDIFYIYKLLGYSNLEIISIYTDLAKNKFEDIKSTFD